MARKRQEAADREAKLEAARKAEEERLAAIHADEERAAQERKAAEEAALAKRAAEFKKEAIDLMANTPVPATDFLELKSPNDVKQLPAATQERISALAEKARGLHRENGNERLIEAYNSHILSVSAMETRGKVAREIRASNAAAALADVNSFLKDNPSPPSDAQKDLWKSLVSIRSLCNRLDQEAKTHIEKAQSLSSSGRAGDAIQEFQIANRIFPDPKVADTIKQLRENSLGL
jgi:hypothetical protein